VIAVLKKLSTDSKRRDHQFKDMMEGLRDKANLREVVVTFPSDEAKKIIKKMI